MRNGGIFRGFGVFSRGSLSVFVVFSHPKEERFESAPVKGDERIEIVSLPCHRDVGQKQDNDGDDARTKAPEIEESGQHEQADPHELEGVPQLVASLGKIGDGDKGHIEDDLGDQPPDAYREISQNQAAHDR